MLWFSILSFCGANRFLHFQYFFQYFFSIHKQVKKIRPNFPQYPAVDTHNRKKVFGKEPCWLKDKVALKVFFGFLRKILFSGILTRSNISTANPNKRHQIATHGAQPEFLDQTLMVAPSVIALHINEYAHSYIIKDPLLVRHQQFNAKVQNFYLLEHFVQGQ